MDQDLLGGGGFGASPSSGSSSVAPPTPATSGPLHPHRRRDEYTHSVTLGDHGICSNQRSSRPVPILPADLVRTLPVGTGVTCCAPCLRSSPTCAPGPPASMPTSSQGIEATWKHTSSALRGANQNRRSLRGSSRLGAVGDHATRNRGASERVQHDHHARPARSVSRTPSSFLSGRGVLASSCGTNNDAAPDSRMRVRARVRPR